MKILAIETSCDETGVSIIEAKGGLTKPVFSVLANITASQISLHNKYGGVFPMMAKREHAKNLTPILEQILKDAKLFKSNLKPTDYRLLTTDLETLLSRELELLADLSKLLPTIKRPDIDAIAVTYGPGLEPTLWVGINFAKALSLAWDIPVIPVNHMEGHVVSALLADTADLRGLNADLRRKKANPTLNAKRYTLYALKFPALALLISGGHTELVLMKGWFKYKIVGETRDDAVGEAFDKVARMLGLPYPGGPYISALAKFARTNADLTPVAEQSSLRGTAQNNAEFSLHSLQRPSASSLRKSAGQTHGDLISVSLPRPMLHSKDFDFSFSGLKTAVLYLIQNLTKEHSNILENVGMKQTIAREFEDAVTEVLTAKTLAAVKKYKIKTLILGGGVAANDRIRESISREMAENFPDCKFYLPPKNLTGDNALMIAVAGYLRCLDKKSNKTRVPKTINAKGNLRL